MAQKTRYAVLGVLTIEDSSGYDIHRFLENSVRHFWSESFGQIYPILNKLEKEGAVRSREEPSGGRKRRVYSIEEKGREELRTWLTASSTEARSHRNELLLKLFFCNDESAPVIADEIRRLRLDAAANLAEYRRLEEGLRSEAWRESSFNYWMATLDYGRIVAEAQQEWCDRTLRAIEERLGDGSPE